MEIKVQNSAKVNAEGIRVKKNHKPVLCITTGLVFASVGDAAEYAGVTEPTMSRACNVHGAYAKGKRYCFIANVMEYFDEITTCIQIREEKVAKYDAIMERQESERKAKEALARHKENCERLRRKLDEEISLMNAAETEVNKYTQNQKIYMI